jgi:Tol biopolymer transport system component
VTNYRTILDQTSHRFAPPELPLEGVLRRRDRRRSHRRLAAGIVGLALGLAAIAIGASVLRAGGEAPADDAPPFHHNGLIALANGDTLTLLDPRTGQRSEVSLRSGRGGYEITGSAWSPDGTKFAYSTYQQGSVRVLDLASGRISTIVPCDAPPPYRVGCPRSLAWSPDGSRIALGGSRGLELVDPDGSNRTTLIDVSDGRRGYVGSPTWSPDGATIAFLARLPAAPNPRAVYAIDADGSNLRILFEQPGPGGLDNLRWSPDGSRIAYIVSATDPDPPDPSLPAVIPEVWIANADGSRTTKLFEGGPCCAVHGSTGLSWSPDGTTIALIGSAAGSRYTLVGQLYVLDPGDGDVRVLARHIAFVGPPEWQPVP